MSLTTMSNYIQVFGAVPPALRVRTVEATLRRLPRTGLHGLRIDDRVWRALDVDTAVAALRAHATNASPIHAYFAGRTSRDDVYVDLESCDVDGHRWSSEIHPEYAFELKLSSGYKRIGTHSRAEIECPLPASREEMLAIAGVIWAQDVEMYLPIAYGTNERGPSDLWMSAEGLPPHPFEAFAVAHADAASFALDYARTWLIDHVGMNSRAVLEASASQLQAWVDAASDAPGPRPWGRNVWGDAVENYDGSLTRASVLRILARRSSEVAAAIEAAAPPQRDVEALLAEGRQALAALANGSPSTTLSIGRRMRPYPSRFHRYEGGAVVLHTSQFHPVWPVYREAARLLAGA